MCVCASRCFKVWSSCVCAREVLIWLTKNISSNYNRYLSNGEIKTRIGWFWCWLNTLGGSENESANTKTGWQWNANQSESLYTQICRLSHHWCVGVCVSFAMYRAAADCCCCCCQRHCRHCVDFNTFRINVIVVVANFAVSSDLLTCFFFSSSLISKAFSIDEIINAFKVLSNNT